jgi:hypothetical protein
VRLTRYLKSTISRRKKILCLKKLKAESLKRKALIRKFLFTQPPFFIKNYWQPPMGIILPL